MRYQSHLEKGTEFTKFLLPRNVPRIQIWNLRVHVVPLNIVWCIHLIKNKKNKKKINDNKQKNLFFAGLKRWSGDCTRLEIRPYYILMIPGISYDDNRKTKTKKTSCVTPLSPAPSKYSVERVKECVLHAFGKESWQKRASEEQVVIILSN